MSWDVILIKTNRCDLKSYKELIDQDVINYDKDTVADLICKAIPKIDRIDEEWMEFESDSFACSINLSAPPNIMLHFHLFEDNEEELMRFIVSLCDLLACRAVDTSTAEFMF